VGLVDVSSSGSADVKINGAAHSVTTGDILEFKTGAGNLLHDDCDPSSIHLGPLLVYHGLRPLGLRDYFC
jgi:hypothetical protein